MQTAQNLSKVKKEYSDISWQNNVKAYFKNILAQQKQKKYSPQQITDNKRQ